jgi:CheY-like chemotaxis protein
VLVAKEQALFHVKKWPRLPHEEMVRRARILVIDDQEFPYKELFERDGYTVAKWNDVEDLPQLERGNYDLILLDLLGVGRKESTDQGLGVLRHIRGASPAQLVVAYSSADWPVRYQPFFDMADGVLSKTADYVDFKAKVDELLTQRFELGFYVGRVRTELADYAADMPGLARKTRRAILTGNTDRLRRYLSRHVDNPATVDRAINIVGVAIGILGLWKS